MARYRRVETAMWSDRKFRELSRPQPSAQALWLYLLCGQRTTVFPGLVVATLAVVADDLGWPVYVTGMRATGEGPRSTMEAWQEIFDRGMATADWSSGVIIVAKALVDSSGSARETAHPTSPNAFKGWSKSWSDIPECPLKDEYFHTLECFANALGNAYVEAFSKAFARHIARRSEPARVLLSPVSCSDLRSGSGSGSDDNPTLTHQAPDPERDLPGDPLPASADRIPVSTWHQRAAWWNLMLEADARLRSRGIEPGAPRMSKTCAGENEKNMAACVRHLVDSGHSPDEVDAKMRHLVDVRERDAIRENHRKWFKPSVIWEPKNAIRGFDTSLDEASSIESRKSNPPKSARSGRLEPHHHSEYPDGEIPPEIAFADPK